MGVLAVVLGASLLAGGTAVAAEPTVFASGLDNPRGLTFGPDGNLYVAEAGTGGSLAEQVEHGRRDVHRRHVPEPAGRREGELPGARPQVHHHGTGAEALGRESVQVSDRIRVSLLAVEAGHEGRVEVLGTRVRHLVDHP
jgi:hypothetical protein